MVLMSWQRALGLLGLIGFSAIAAVGCNVDRIAVNTTASVLVDAESGTRGYFDWESAGYAAASGIVQLEGLHSVSPDNEALSLTLVKAYMAYAYGWVMDAHDIAEARGDFETADHEQRRAYLMYTRAKNVALRVLRNRDAHFAEYLAKDPVTLRAYLAKHFHDVDDDVPPLFWLVMSWNAAVNNSPSMDEFVDMPAIRTIAEWIAHQNAAYEDAGVLVFLGGFASSYPKQLGGNPEQGKAYFERALALTQRRNHIALVNYATLYGINAQDRELFVSLLREVVQAGDAGGRYRLGNKVARRRALRFLARVDELFIE